MVGAPVSTIQTFLASFGILLIAACPIIAAVMFCREWFGTRRRIEAQMRVLGDDYQSCGILHTVWHGLQAFLFCLISVIFVIGMGLWALLVLAWYRIRGRPLPAPNYEHVA